MRSLCIVLILSASLMCMYSKPIIKTARITIGSLEIGTDFDEDWLPDVYEALNYAFEYGSGSQARMVMLEVKLRELETTQHVNWFVSENATGFYHTGRQNAYFEITNGNVTSSVKIAYAR